MTLTEFREEIKSNPEEIINEINEYIGTIDNNVSKNFTNETYEFSWSSLTREVQKYKYQYSKKNNQLIKMTNEVIINEIETDTFIIDKKYDNYNATLTSKINKDVLDKFKSFCDDYNMISQAYILSKLLSEAIEKYSKE